MWKRIWFDWGYRLLSTMLIIIVMFVSLLGCSPGDEELTAADVLSRSIKAVNEVNSYVFEMETSQDIIIQELENISTKYIISGRAIEEPMAAEIDVQINTAESQVDLKMYLADDVIYLSIPDVGWVLEDITDDFLHSQAYGDPLDYINTIHEVDEGEIKMEKGEEYYFLTYEDDGRELGELMKEQLREQLGTKLYYAPELEVLFDMMELAEFRYFVTIERSTFLPGKNILNYKFTMELSGETVGIDQKTTINYLEFDKIDSIIIPDEVINEAVPSE